MKQRENVITDVNKKLSEFDIDMINNGNIHCVKSVQIRSYFWSVFSRIRTEYGPEITPYLDTFHEVIERSHLNGKGLHLNGKGILY